MHRWFHRGGAGRIFVLEFAFLASAVFTLGVRADDTTAAHSASTQPSVNRTATRAPSTAPTAAPALNQTLAAIVRQAVAQKNCNVTAIQGGAFAQIPYADYSSDGILIGFRIGLGKFFSNDVIKTIQPIYLTDRGEQVGQKLGGSGSGYSMVELKAPPGYAIGAVKIRGGGGLDAITVTVMRITAIGLNPSDARLFPRIGGTGGGEASFTGNGSPAVGITGRIDPKGDWIGLGLIFLNPTAPESLPEFSVPVPSDPSPSEAAPTSPPSAADKPAPDKPAPAKPSAPIGPDLKAVDAMNASGAVEV
jgi:hypothetical protein